MSRHKNDRRTVSNRPHLLDRRAAIQHAVTGGSALAMWMSGGLTGAAVGAVAEQSSNAGAPPWMSGRIRRVVTGHNAQGRSCVITDEMVNVGNLWITSREEPLGAVGTPIGQKVLPTADLSKEPHGPLKPSDAPNVDPPVGGTRLSMSTIAMTTGTPKPAMNNRVGRHRTVTIDYGLVLGNGLVCVLDEQEVKLNQFDLIVQRNTDHAWRNDGNANILVLFNIVRV